MTYDLSSWLADRTNPDQFAQFEYGIVTAVTGFTKATVNLAGLEVPMPLAYPAVAGDIAMVIRQGDRRIAVRSMGQPNPLSGSVTAIGATTVTVTVNGVTGIVLRRHNGYAPTIGDSVHIVDGAVLDKWASAPPPPSAPVPPPPPPPPPQTGTYTFQARDAGTFRNSAWRTDSFGVYQGDGPGISGMNNGAWFYGTSLSDALNGATISGLRVWINRTRAGVFAAQAVHLWQHTSPWKPAGDVTRIGSVFDIFVAVDQYGWVGIPASWGQNLVNGTARGIGITGAPYLRLAALSEDPQSGSLSIDWTR